MVRGFLKTRRMPSASPYGASYFWNWCYIALSTNFGQRIIQETGYAYLDIFPNGSIRPLLTSLEDKVKSLEVAGAHAQIAGANAQIAQLSAELAEARSRNSALEAQLEAWEAVREMRRDLRGELTDEGEGHPAEAGRGGDLLERPERHLHRRRRQLLERVRVCHFPSLEAV